MSALRGVTVRRVITAVLGFGLLGGFLLGGLSGVRLETGVGSFLPSKDPAVNRLDEMARSFGGDPIVVLAETDQSRELLDAQHLQRLVRLEGQLAVKPDVAAVYGPGTVLNQVAGQAQDLLVELSARRDTLRAQAEAGARQAGADQADVTRAGDHALAEFDARYGPLIVQGLPAGLPTLRNGSFVTSAVYTPDGQPRAQWRFVVPSANSVAILVRPRQGLDQAATKQLAATVRETVGAADLDAGKVTVSGVPVLADSLGTQVEREIPIIGGLAVLAVSGWFLFIPWARRSRRLLPVITTLLSIGLTVAVFGWLDRPLSLGVVAFLPVLLGIGSYYPTYFAQRARPRTVLVVAAATAASFTTLLLSPLPFVRDLGLTLGIGVLLSALLGLLLARFRPAPPQRSERSDKPRTRPTRAPSPAGRATVALMAVLIAAGGWAALPGMPLQSDFRTFAAGLSALDDARHVEQVLGSSGEMDVVLRGPDVTSPEALDWMRRAQQTIVADHGDAMRPVISPPTLLNFLGREPTDDQVQAGLRMLPPYLTGSVIRGDNEVALLSFGVRMDDLGALGKLRDEVNASLPPPPPGFRAEPAGLPMVAVRGNELVSDTRVAGNVLGIVAAGTVLALGLRRREDALRAMASAAIATGAGLLCLWLLGIPLSPITVAVGSLTAAVGCEFTVLLCEATRRGRPDLRRSVVLATVTSATGYAVLAVSQLAAIREFGLLLAGSVLLAYLSARCVAWLTTSRRGPEAESTAQVEKTSLAGVR